MKEVLLFLVMFWNVENFYDTFNDAKVNDDAYTPKGEKYWTWKKFQKKRDDIARVIMLAKEEYGIFPAVIGLCEVENAFVLKQLTQQTPLARLGYKYVHKDSPDKRGIDVALLYRPECFKVLNKKFYPLKISTPKKVTASAPEEEAATASATAAVSGSVLAKEAVTASATADVSATVIASAAKDSILASRLIVYVKGLVNNLDTVHILVNHWPSKLGGEKASMPKRLLASNTVNNIIDSILYENSKSNIIVMGDFNDTPKSKPLKNLKNLNNLMLNINSCGSHKYKDSWELIDQILISNNLIENSNSINYFYCKKSSAEVFMPTFMLQKDDLYLGMKLKKSLSGPRYLGGVSDHLPVVLKIYGVDY